MRKLAGSIVVLASVLLFSAFGQDVVPPADDQQVCSEDFARTLVEQQAAESRSVEATDKRVRMLIRSADFLWKHDQPRAREYFTEAFKVANDRYSEKGFERKEFGGGISVQSPDYRFEVVRAIAKLDPSWATKLTDEVMREYEKSRNERDSLDRDREITSMLQIAQDHIKLNPALSWYLYRRLMKMDLEGQWYWALFSAAGEDRTFADALYNELLVSHANATPRRVVYLSAYPFARGRMFGYEAMSYGAYLPEGMTPNPQLQVRFLDLLLRRTEAYASDPANYSRTPEPNRPQEAVYIVSALQEMEPLINESFPAFLPRFNAARARATSMLNADGRKSLDDREKWKSRGTKGFDERIAELEKADEQGKLTDSMILNVLISGMLKTEEQFARLEPWIEKMSESEARGRSSDYFWFLRSQLARKEKRFPDAQKYAAKVRQVEYQAILMFEIAEKQLEDVNDAATVYDTLADIGRMARRADDSVGKAKVLLGLAYLYEKVNHSFAISELGEAVAVANRLKDADLQNEYILLYIKVKDMAFGASVGTPGYDLENTFAKLSKNDFSLPLSNARAIDDKFYRTIAVIAVAKNCVDRPRPKVRR